MARLEGTELMQQRRWSTRITLLIAGAVLVSACQSAAPVATQQPAAQSQAPAPATFVYAVPAVATTVDPAIYQGDASRFTAWGQLSSLVVYDSVGLKGEGCEQLATINNVRGELAESWRLKDDKSAYVVTLRPAKSQYGNTVTSQDVAWSIDRLTALSGISRSLRTSHTRYQDNPIKVIDDRTFELMVKQPTALDIALNTVGPFAMGIVDSVEVKKHATADDPWAAKWLATNSANFGPWQVDSFTPGQEVVYTPNPNYWGKRGNVNRLIIRSIPESSTRLQLLATGTVDWAARLNAEEYTQLQGNSNVKVLQCQSANRDYIMASWKGASNTKFADPRVRKAVSLGIDRAELAKSIYRGFGTPSQTGWPATYNAPSSGEKYTYDVVRAKALLAEAGHPNGLDATITINAAIPGPYAEASAILIRDQLAKIGLRLKIETIASATDFNTRFRAGQFELILQIDSPAIADPQYSASTYNKTGASANVQGYSNPAYDKLVNDMALLGPGAERDKLLLQLDKMMMDDQPVIYLVDTPYLNAFRTNISGYQAAPHGEVLVSNIIKR